MTLRSVVAVLVAVMMMISAVQLSTWALGRALSIVAPSASVGDAETSVPQASEIDTPPPTIEPVLTW
jgi:hypothetical protein